MTGDRQDTWSVAHLVRGEAGVTGYQIAGPASFLIFGDEVDGLMTLLAGIKVEEAIDPQHDRNPYIQTRIIDPNIDPDTGWAIDPVMDTPTNEDTH